MGEEYKHKELTHKIIGCAMKVHRTLRNGFQERIYQRALAVEMTDCGLNFIREKEMAIFYNGRDIGTRRVDFFVEETVMLEIKATTELTRQHLNQGLNYLEAYAMEIGLLINFGSNSLEFKRLINSPLYHKAAG